MTTSGTEFGDLETVPEPTSAALVLSGLGLLSLRRRRDEAGKGLRQRELIV